MIVRTCLFILLLLLAPCCVAESCVQEHSAAGPAVVTTGQAVTMANGPWRFHIGDDPCWADPGFDDSTWEVYTIDPSHGSLTVPEAIGGAPLRGWQAHGHPGYVGYAWYRIRVDRAPDTGALAILMPRYVDDTYEIYVNGKQIGAFGQVEGRRLFYLTRPKLFPIPAGIIPTTGPFTIALRFRAFPFEGLPGENDRNGGLRGVPLLGPAPLLAMCYEAETGQIINHRWANAPVPFLFGSVGLISLFLFHLTRTRREYLWAGISLCGFALMMGSNIVARLAPIPVQIIYPLELLGEWIGLSTGPISAMYQLSVHKPLWRRLNYISMAVLAAGIAILLCVYVGMAPPTVGWHEALKVSPFSLFCVALLVVAIAIDGVRTLGAKAWMLLMPGLVGACGLVAQLAGQQFSIVSEVLYGLVPVSLLIVFLLRAAQQHRENEQYLLDMRQAQEVQQLLLPEQLPQVAGFSIESVYLPAREVGGDFFQVLETTPGSVLMVFGDVAGKGLPAAMLVAMLVGAIRTRAKETDDPPEMLSTLNERLCGSARGGFATCIVIHISADGTVYLANAGHLAPYLNGKEITLEGALPLGVALGIDFTTARFVLNPGDRLTFVSDGVVEAKDRRQELFGFDRLREISSEEARQIADAAKQFGQEDDITVLTFRRLLTPA